MFSVKQFITFLTWLCVLFVTCMPAPIRADLCTIGDEVLERRTRVAYAVAGLTVIALVAGIAVLGVSSRNHNNSHCHSVPYTNSSIDNYRPYSNDSHHSSDSYDSHRYHSYRENSNPYTIFSSNEVSSFSDDSYSERSNRFFPRGRPLDMIRSQNAAEQEHSLSGQFIVNSSISSREERSLTVFVQLPNGTSRSLGSLSLTGSGSLSYGPFYQKGLYTFGVSLDQGNLSSSRIKVGTIQIEVEGSTLQQHDFFAPPHAPGSYEPPPYCFELN